MLPRTTSLRGGRAQESRGRSRPNGEPPFQRDGMDEHTVGMTGAAMISTALVARQTTGKGQVVTTSLLRQGAYAIGFDVNTYLMWGRQFQGGDRKNMAAPTVNNYLAGDRRRFWIVDLEGERHWPPLARAVRQPEWLDDDRFASPLSRRQRRSSSPSSTRSSRRSHWTSGRRSSRSNPTSSGPP